MTHAMRAQGQSPQLVSGRRGSVARAWASDLAVGLLALAWLAAAAACEQDSTPQTAPALDAERYETEVQPFVAASCATLDCHGAAGRPLRLYSELGLRRSQALRPDPISEHSEPLPLSPAELSSNIEAFAALLPELSPGAEQLVLSKPLAESAGGGAHVGGDLFDDRDSPGYRCLARWLEGSDAHADSCALALDALPSWP